MALIPRASAAVRPVGRAPVNGQLRIPRSPGGGAPLGAGLAPKAPANPPDPAGRIQARINYLQKVRPNDPSIAGYQKKLAGLQPAQPPAPTTPPAPDGTANNPQEQPLPNVTQQETPQDNYKTFRDFLPADVTASPEYQWRLRQGEDQLNKRLSSMGLGDSGSAILQDANLVNGLTADEISRQTGLATGEADRYERTQQNAALASRGQSQDQWSRIMDVMNLASRQDPFQQAYDALGNTAGSYVDQGKADAGFVKDRYGRVVSGGSGGGGAQAPAYAPPFASSPNYNPLDIYNSGAGTQNNSGYGQAVGSLLNGALKYFGS